jgi:hypothetical protein
MSKDTKMDITSDSVALSKLQTDEIKYLQGLLEKYRSRVSELEQIILSKNIDEKTQKDRLDFKYDAYLRAQRVILAEADRAVSIFKEYCDDNVICGHTTFVVNFIDHGIFLSETSASLPIILRKVHDMYSCKLEWGTTDNNGKFKIDDNKKYVVRVTLLPPGKTS